MPWQSTDGLRQYFNGMKGRTGTIMEWFDRNGAAVAQWENRNGIMDNNKSTAMV